MAFATDGKLGIDFSARVAGTTTDGAGCPFRLGTMVSASDGSRWIHVQAGAAIGATDAVTVDENYQATGALAAGVDAGHIVALAGGTAFSDNDFGWVCIQGTGQSVNAASGCAADTALYTTTTAGRLDDATSAAGGTAQSRIAGIVLVSTATADTVTACGAILTSPRAYSE
jgi:hypothetical protein